MQGFCENKHTPNKLQITWHQVTFRYDKATTLTQVFFPCEVNNIETGFLSLWSKQRCIGSSFPVKETTLNKVLYPCEEQNITRKVTFLWEKIEPCARPFFPAKKHPTKQATNHMTSSHLSLRQSNNSIVHSGGEKKPNQSVHWLDPGAVSLSPFVPRWHPCAVTVPHSVDLFTRCRHWLLLLSIPASPGEGTVWEETLWFEVFLYSTGLIYYRIRRNGRCACCSRPHMQLLSQTPLACYRRYTTGMESQD